MATGMLSPRQKACFQYGNMIFFQPFFWSSSVPLPSAKWKDSMPTSAHWRVSLGSDFQMVLCPASNLTEVLFSRRQNANLSLTFFFPFLSENESSKTPYRIMDNPCHRSCTPWQPTNFRYGSRNWFMGIHRGAREKSSPRL